MDPSTADYFSVAIGGGNPPQTSETLKNLASSRDVGALKPKLTAAQLSSSLSGLALRTSIPFSGQFHPEMRGLPQPGAGIVQHRAARLPSIESVSFSQGLAGFTPRYARFLHRFAASLTPLRRVLLPVHSPFPALQRRCLRKDKMTRICLCLHQTVYFLLSFEFYYCLIGT